MTTAAPRPAVEEPAAPSPHRISVVVPVYQGQATLPALLGELAPMTKPSDSPAGNALVVHEVLLVFDHGPDDSARVIRELAEQYDFVRPVWLSRNFGQHAATLAGMASSGGEWIVTMDEDGQHDPADIAGMLDVALAESADLVYASPTNAAPHGFMRNLTSSGAKWVARHLVGSTAPSSYHSFRLVLGEVGRSVAAYAGVGVYLDVAIGWVVNRVGTAPVRLRTEGDRRSGYTARRLLSHFWRMVLTGGTRGLRAVSALGAILAVVGFVLGVVLVALKVAGSAVPQGWTSLAVIMLFSAGAILFALGIVAEYLGVTVNMAMGKPLYVIVADSADGPLGRRQGADARRP